MELRTYTVFEIWRESVRLLHSFGVSYLLLFVPGIVALLILAFGGAIGIHVAGVQFEQNPFPSMPGFQPSRQQQMMMAAAVPLVGTVALMAVLNLILAPLSVLWLAYQALGKPISPRMTLQRLKRFILPLIGSMLLAFLINGTVALLGLFLMVVPGGILGLLFYVWYHFVPAVVILEGEGGRGALRRSRSLSRDFFWKVSGCVPLPFVLEFLLIGQILMLASDLLYDTVGLGGWAWLGIGLSTPLLLLLEGIKFLVGMLIYFDLRIRKDGFDRAMLARELEENLS